VAQAVDSLPSKNKALNSNLSTTKIRGQLDSNVLVKMGKNWLVE
jgi:hypothetical protein